MGQPKTIVKQASSGEFYWSAKAGNGEIQAHGEMHPSRPKAKRAWHTFLTVTCVALLRGMGYTVYEPEEKKP